MKGITITTGPVTPILCNRFTDERENPDGGPTVTGDRGTPKEQAEKKLYIGSDGKPMIPGPNMFRCLIDAGKYFKIGKSKVTTLKSSIIPACVSIEEIEIPIQTKEGWTVDTRPVRIPSTGGRILCHRPSFHDWSLTFRVELDEKIMGIKMFREIVDAAGKRIGLGDFRPDCKGPFGKFVVTHWDVEELDDGKTEEKGASDSGVSAEKAA